MRYYTHNDTKRLTEILQLAFATPGDTYDHVAENGQMMLVNIDDEGSVIEFATCKVIPSLDDLPSMLNLLARAVMLIITEDRAEKIEGNGFTLEQAYIFLDDNEDLIGSLSCSASMKRVLHAKLQSSFTNKSLFVRIYRSRKSS